MTPAANSYDLLPYESGAFVETHPERLATLATLFGLDPPPIARCPADAFVLSPHMPSAPAWHSSPAGAEPLTLTGHSKTDPSV